MIKRLLAISFCALLTWDVYSYTHPETIPYKLEHPTTSFALPDILFEISGLTISKDGKHLIAIQDENGIVFKIDIESGALVKQFNFWKDGDYEGVETVGEEIFVIKSTGTIYGINKPDSPKQEVIKYKFFLTKENDVEGLGYDKKNNRLLIACKAQVRVGEVKLPEKQVFGFDLASKVLSPTPVFTIDLNQVKDYLAENEHIKGYAKINEFFKRSDDKFKFSPCAIAVHPITGNIYMTSSVGKLLIIINPEGTILHIEKLKKSLHPQPEGLCFDAKGNLYIANEGDDEAAVIHKYIYLP